VSKCQWRGSGPALAHGRQLLHDALFTSSRSGLLYWISLYAASRIAWCERKFSVTTICRASDSWPQEAQDVGDGGTAKPVDGLVVVTRHRDVSVSRREQLHQLELRVVRVLEFVDQDVFEAALVRVETWGRARRSRSASTIWSPKSILSLSAISSWYFAYAAPSSARRPPVQLLLVIGARPQPGRHARYSSGEMSSSLQRLNSVMSDCK